MSEINYQEEIRKLLDEEGLINKELTFGCIIKNHSTMGDLENRKVTAVEWSDFKRDFEVVVIYFSRSGLITRRCWGKELEILGHPWDLREVMAWFSQKYKSGECSHYCYWDCGDARMMIEIVPKETEESFYLTLDLSTPLSKQDLKPLYELMINLKK